MSKKIRNPNNGTTSEQIWTFEQAADFLEMTTPNLESLVDSGVFEIDDDGSRTIPKESLLGYLLSNEDRFRALASDLSSIEAEPTQGYKNPWDRNYV